MQLRHRDRRALLGLAAALGLYLLLSYVVFPGYDRFTQARTDVAQQEDQLRKYRRALTRKDQYGQLTQRADTALSQQQSRFFSADKGLAELQATVESTADAAGLVLSQRNVVAGRRRDPLVSEVSMTVSGEATTAQLVNFLNGLRQSPRFLTVTSSQIGPTQPFRELPPTGDFRKTLRVSLTVVGLIINSDLAPVK